MMLYKNAIYAIFARLKNAICAIMAINKNAIYEVR